MFMEFYFARHIWKPFPGFSLILDFLARTYPCNIITLQKPVFDETMIIPNAIIPKPCLFSKSCESDYLK